MSITVFDCFALGGVEKEYLFKLIKLRSQVGWVEVRNPIFSDSMKQLTR